MLHLHVTVVDGNIENMHFYRTADLICIATNPESSFCCLEFLQTISIIFCFKVTMRQLQYYVPYIPQGDNA